MNALFAKEWSLVLFSDVVTDAAKCTASTVLPSPKRERLSA
jgi:hypothetical protein